MTTLFSVKTHRGGEIHINPTQVVTIRDRADGGCEIALANRDKIDCPEKSELIVARIQKSGRSSDLPR